MFSGGLPYKLRDWLNMKVNRAEGNEDNDKERVYWSVVTHPERARYREKEFEAPKRNNNTTSSTNLVSIM